MKYIYVDFENVPKINEIADEDVKLVLFIGENQRKLSTEVVKSIQPLGKKVEWIQINGTGKNALDFHIAYYLALNKDEKNVEHFVVSKDTGYDPLIKHANAKGQSVKRVVSVNDAFTKVGLNKDQKTKYIKAQEGLMKQPKVKRPKSRKALASYLETIFQKNVSTTEVDAIIENLFREKYIEERNKRISYLK